MWGGPTSIMSGRCASVALILLFSNTVAVNSASLGCSMTTPCKDQLGQGQDFVQPTQFQCGNDHSSSCSLTLNVDIGTLTFDWFTIYRRLYNKKATGPTIKVRKGDVLNVNLVNHLSHVRNENGNPINKLRHPNTTNLHTHGLHITSNDPQDNVLLAVDPESSYQYRYDIHQHNSPGTYWYHAHIHGSTALQVNGGMGGMIIIEDDPDHTPWQLNKASCPENCDHDLQFVFQPLLRFGGFGGYEGFQEHIHDYKGFRTDKYVLPGGGTLTEWLVQNMKNVTTNGLVRPKLKLNKGEMYRFRMVNAAGRPNYEVYITKGGINNPTTDCEIREIAMDGVYLPKPRVMHTGQSLILPGGRVDWMVKCNVAGTYQLSSHHKAENDKSLGAGQYCDDELVTLEVTANNNDHDDDDDDDHHDNDDDDWHHRWHKRSVRGSRHRRWYNNYNNRYDDHDDDDDDHHGYNGYDRDDDHHGDNGDHRDDDHHGDNGDHRDDDHHGDNGDHRDDDHHGDNGHDNDHGDSGNIDFPNWLPSIYQQDLRNYPEEKIQGRFVVEFTNYPATYIINREAWKEPIIYRYKMRIGEVQEWTLLNTNFFLAHPLHIHVNHFQVISYNNYTGGYAMYNDNTWYLNNVMDVDKNCYHQHPGYTPDTASHPPTPASLKYLGHNKNYAKDDGTIGYARVGDWKDTLLVPPLANITIRFKPIDFACDVIMHCHILEHEDEGMMILAKIVNEGESLRANIKAGNAYPGTCDKCDRYPPNNATNLCGEKDPRRRK